jgi:hypothetical protein
VGRNAAPNLAGKEIGQAKGERKVCSPTEPTSRRQKKKGGERADNSSHVRQLSSLFRKLASWPEPLSRTALQNCSRKPFPRTATENSSRKTLPKNAPDEAYFRETFFVEAIKPKYCSKRKNSRWPKSPRGSIRRPEVRRDVFKAWPTSGRAASLDMRRSFRQAPPRLRKKEPRIVKKDAKKSASETPMA